MRYFSANDIFVSVKMKYRAFKEKIIGEKNVSYYAYGIEMTEGKTKVRKSDITCSYPKIKKLCSLCNRLKLDACHIDDVIEDFLCK